MQRRCGFIGLGIMGRAMALNLVRAGFDVTVWNRTAAKCEELAAAGARVADGPAAVAAACPVTFAMVADPAAAEAVCLGPGGVVEGLGPGKGYVDMSTVDPGTSRRIGAAVAAAAGRFLEAPVAGSRKPAEEGTLVIFAAGDPSLLEEVRPAFDVLSKRVFYLGETGRAAQLKLLNNLVMGGMMAALAEGISLAEGMDLPAETLLEVLDSGPMANGLFRLKGAAMVEGRFPAAFPLKHMQKDLRLALAEGDRHARPLPVTAAVNALFVGARGMGLGEADFAAVLEAVRGRRG
ncbi:NAD(P)-dependent oxidoreductase [Dissulfurirhabdus thermomarina]|uniref:NAD(P)-dependent oxidoreductase n=1 Tax=Dissulfurirhabdus thermomarina TaxID=1765737 RepID=A0A6N9TPR2_DISTH|nr:NAD(P)-dependent oxidoreductase [Dissulfurirhabdus thermomarina]NDY43038.1 NAD(P)-dependent oxidoreductase [Dissulfurirhabdus thermomarina]NMX22730.1 NAD(P)-dependent oxidoreductase [Dissulfurirhabdus thermomarina]